jgi:hypothetical protein
LLTVATDIGEAVPEHIEVRSMAGSFPQARPLRDATSVALRLISTPASWALRLAAVATSAVGEPHDLEARSRTRLYDPPAA